jgi:2-hydroxy-3-oxopropionate reductase
MLGFIGVGRMGNPMTARLLAAGYEVIVCDPDARATAALAAQGAIVAASPKEAADRAATVLLSLPTPQVVIEAGLGAQGVLHGGAARAVIDLSTTGPQAAEQLAQGLQARGIQAVDCPVSGGVTGAARGTLSLMAAAPRASYEALQPVLAALGRARYIGERPGMAQMMKVINNLVSVTALAVTSETMVLGVKAGLDPDVMIEAINAGSGRSNSSEDKIPKYVLTGRFDFGFALGLSVKDIRLCLEESERLGVPLRVGDAVRRLLNDASEKYGADADLTELIRYTEDAAGARVRGKAAGA